MYQATYMLFTFLQPHVDFGLKLLGADLMAMPGLFGFAQVRSTLTGLSFHPSDSISGIHKCIVCSSVFSIY
jgi:hypothetical protein